MYSLINLCIKDYVISVASEEGWQKICKDADHPAEVGEQSKLYPGYMTYKVIGLVSRKILRPHEDVFCELGRHAVSFIDQNGYSAVINTGSPTFKEALFNLNAMHNHFRTLLPDIPPTQFRVSEIKADVFAFECTSNKFWSASLFKGIIEGLALRYSINASVRQVVSREAGPSYRLLIEV